MSDKAKIIKGIGLNQPFGGFRALCIDGVEYPVSQILTPPEVASREAAAWRAGRDAAAAWHAEQAAQWERIDKSHGAHKRHLSHAANIRALTPPGNLDAAQEGE